MKNCPENIAALFRFLVEHHEYNKKIQEADIRRTLSSYGNVPDRARRLLYEIFNTQSQVRMEFMAEFFLSVENAANQTPPNLIATYADFQAFLGIARGQKSGLFEALSSRRGWGDKTSALFIRNLAMIASNTELSQMFWPDIQAVNDEPIRLPVDAVIKAIFRHLPVPPEDPSYRLREKEFEKINCFLRCNLGYDDKDMLIWDDLWFWGFITQKSKAGTNERQHQWNKAKYWSIFTAPKDAVTISDIERLATNFLSLTGHPVSTET